MKKVRRCKCNIENIKSLNFIINSVLTTKFSSMEAPAFYHSYIQHKGKRIGVIKLNPQLIQYLSKESVRDNVHPRMLPMLVHPRPWLTFNSGGYLTSPSMKYIFLYKLFSSFI